MHITNLLPNPNHPKVATIILFKNALLSLVFYGSITVLAQVTTNVFGFLPQVVAVLLMLSTVPEIALIFKPVRVGVWNAITKGDNKFDWSDFIDTIIVWAAVLPIRVVVFAFILKLMGVVGLSMIEIVSILVGTPVIASIKGLLSLVRETKTNQEK